MAERICARCEQPEWSHPVSPELQCEKFEPQRECTCHPDDNPPVPCAEKYALTECRRHHYNLQKADDR